MNLRRVSARALVGLVVTCALAPVAVAAAEPQPPFIPATADWLTVVNYHRAMAGLGSVTEDAAFSDGAAKHSCYMLLNGMSHDEIPGRPGYTPEGDAAGNNGNVAVSSALNTSARSHVELWMTGPFHAIGVLRPNLQRVGFGKCDNASTSPWKSAATLDVLRGLGPRGPQWAPILWPGDGTTTNLDRFVAESPDPRSFCGWPDGGGLPVIAMMPEAVNSVGASMSGPGGALEVCTLWRGNTNGVAQSILGGDNAVVVMPRRRLDPGVYTVNVTTQSRSVTWSFTVDPAAANGPVSPPPGTSPVGSPVSYQPLTAQRIVDTRLGLGGSRWAGGSTVRIPVAGANGVPSDATAVQVNATATVPSGYGYLTLWDCSLPRPTTASLTYNPWDTIANSVTVALDSGGALCAYTFAETDVVIDLNGYFSVNATQKYTPLTPERVVDTRIGRGIASRVPAGWAVGFTVRPSATVPTSATSVVLSLTGTGPSSDGYITAYNCDGPLPTAANLNPVWGQSRANLVVAPISASGAVCLYTSSEVDIVVDLTGYFAPDGQLRYQRGVQFRLVDTRDTLRPELNLGRGGFGLAPGQVSVVQVAGTRGIAANAKAVSINVASVGAWGRGYITAWPCGEVPVAATTTFDSADAIANGAFLPLSASGQLCLFSNMPTHVVIDVNGWFS